MRERERGGGKTDKRHLKMAGHTLKDPTRHNVTESKKWKKY